MPISPTFFEHFREVITVNANNFSVASTPETVYKMEEIDNQRESEMTKFGVEIEVVFPQHTGISAFYDKLSAAGIRSDWTTTHDGSISAPYPKVGVEIVSSILNDETGFESITKLCDILDEMSIAVNKSCGLHVHVDANGWKADDIRSVFNRYKQFETEIDKFMPASRRKNENAYCQSLASHNLLAGSSASSAIGMIDRYLKLNVQAYLKHGTIEFRQHSGTTNALKIINWVKFCIGFMKSSKNIQVPVTTDTGIIDYKEFATRHSHARSTVLRNYSSIQQTRVVDFLTNIINYNEQSYNNGSYRIRPLDELINNIPNKPCYATVKKYISIINNIYLTHKNEFNVRVPGNGIIWPFTRDGITTDMFVNLETINNLKYVLNIITRNTSSSFWMSTFEAHLNEFNERLGVTQNNLPAVTEKSMFENIESAVISFYRERAQDFGLTLNV